MEALLIEFAVALRGEGLADSTICLYVRILRRCFTFVARKKKTTVSLDQLDREALQGYLDAQRHMRDVTVKTDYQALRRFFAFVLSKELVSEDPTATLIPKGSTMALSVEARRALGLSAPPLPELIDRFAEHMTQKGHARHTINGYLADLSQCLDTLRRTLRHLERPLEVDDLTHERLQKFLSGLQRRDYKPATLLRKKTAILGFFKFLCARRLCAYNPSLALITPKVPRRLPKFLSLVQAQALVETPQTFSTGEGKETGPPPLPGKPQPIMRVRDGAILEVVYGTGLRASEVADLDVSDLLFDQPAPGDITLHVRHGKGDKERYVVAVGKTVEALQRYLARREELLPRDNGALALFVSVTGLRLHRFGIAATVKRYARQAGVRAYPHLLRHSYATHALWAGADPRALQDSLGHDSGDMTAKYAHTNLPFLKDKCAVFSPRAGGTEPETPAPAAAAPEDPGEVARLKAENAQLLLTVAKMAEKRGPGDGTSSGN